MREFAEEEIILPTGPFEGRRFNASRQPFATLWFAEVDSGRWREVNTTGPQQCGKSLLGFVIPICYHLFEIQETIVVGVPSGDAVRDKWEEDILPVINRTRYRDLLPITGGGSRGGKSPAVKFRNGRTLRWMTAGGGDKSRASFTARTVIVTETDGFDESSTTSREGTKLDQLIGRSRAHIKTRMIFKECTVSTEEGHTWALLKTGSDSRIMTPCPHCGCFMQMEREQLVGWQDAESETQAREAAMWACPECGQQITEDERIDVNHAARLVHRGQEIDKAGAIHGPPPPTKTLGFRWSAFHNLFTDAAELAAEEWRARQAADEDNAEKALRQFVWCLPHKPALVEDAPLDPKLIMRRQDKFPHRELPPDTTHLAYGVDIGKWQSWYVVLAGRACGQVHIPDYGIIEVHSDQMKEEIAVLAALREFRENILPGLPMGDKLRAFDAAWLDAGDYTKLVHQFVRESNADQAWDDRRWWATVGRGESEERRQAWNAPKRRTNEILQIGDGWFISRQPQHRSHLVTVNSDQWILWLQAGLRVPVRNDQGQPNPGAVTLFDPGSDRLIKDRHNKLARHFASEQRTRKMVAGKGMVNAWEKHGANHWLDAAKLAAAALNRAGFRLIAPPAIAGGTIDAGAWFKGRG